MEERPWRQVTILASSPGHGQENCARCDKATRREYIQRGSSVNSALEFLIDFVPCSTRNQTMTEYGVHGVQREGSGGGACHTIFFRRLSSFLIPGDGAPVGINCGSLGILCCLGEHFAGS